MSGRFEEQGVEASGEAMWEVAMWTQCCAACKRVLRKAGYAITSAASAAGNGSGNGNCDRVLRASEIPKTKRKMDSA